jgi:hypothetical protein
MYNAQARETERLGEAAADHGVTIEVYAKRFRVRSPAVAETGMVRRDQLVAAGQARQERLEHAR